LSKAKPREGLNRSYKKRQADSFAYLETNANEWRACEISGINQITGEIHFQIPGYTIVKPITDRLPADQLARLQDQLAASDWAKGLCELCGALIKVPNPIRHDGKKYVMFIGSECVKNYTKAGREYKQKKKDFLDKQMQEQFKNWVPQAIQEVWNKGLDRERHFRPGYYKLKQTLEKAREEADELSSRKIRNLYKKADAFGINVPPEYLPTK
jgi:hypothetical protein